MNLIICTTIRALVEESISLPLDKVWEETVVALQNRKTLTHTWKVKIGQAVLAEK